MKHIWTKGNHYDRTTHGKTSTATYRAWAAMRNRCRNPRVPAYRNYGARGIRVCKRWERFETFLADMGEVAPGYSLERIDNDGHYEPANCCWIPFERQARNRRVVHMLTYNGETRTIIEWAKYVGLKPITLYARLGRYGWPLERALTEAPSFGGPFRKHEALYASPAPVHHSG